MDIAAAKKRCEAAKGIRMCGLSVEGGGADLEALETFIKHARSDLSAALEALKEAQGASEEYENRWIAAQQEVESLKADLAFVKHAALGD